MKLILSIYFQCCMALMVVYGQNISPESTELYLNILKVTPVKNNQPPSDAIVLFNGKDLSEWQKPQLTLGADMKTNQSLITQLKSDWKGEPADWGLSNGEMVVKPKSGNISTKKSFGDIQLHLEWMAPKEENKKGQGYSNSGVFLMSMYEVQILNSNDNETYSNGQASSIYKQYAPLVNATNPPGEWQVYDIIFRAPKFSPKGTLVAPAVITVFLNGVLVQNNVPLLGPTCYIGAAHYVPHADKLPITLQDHGDPVRFRNIWVREL